MHGNDDLDGEFYLEPMVEVSSALEGDPQPVVVICMSNCGKPPQ